MTIPGDHRHGRHVSSALHVHLVFGTTYRRGVLDADVLRSCQDAMRKVRSDFSAELREFTGEDDHVHLLAEYPAEGGGWIDRGRDPPTAAASSSRRPEPRSGILHLYLVDFGMNTALNQICAEYDATALQLLAGFLHRTARRRLHRRRRLATPEIKS